MLEAFLSLACVWLLPCSRMKYAGAAGVVGRNKMITEDPEGKLPLIIQIATMIIIFLLSFDIFLIFLDW